MIFRYDTTILLINIHCFIGDPIGIIIHVICYSLFLTSSGVVLTKLRSFACVSASLTCSADLIFIPRDAQRQIAHVSIIQRHELAWIRLPLYAGIAADVGFDSPLANTDSHFNSLLTKGINFQASCNVGWDVADKNVH